MLSRIAAVIVTVALAPAGSALAQGVWVDAGGQRPGVEEREQERAARERAKAESEQDRTRDRELRAYEGAQRLLDRAEWAHASAAFAEVAALRGARADAALYWKAYTENRVGQRAEALATIAALTKEHPNSRYLQQAKALEVEVRGQSGQPVRPQDQADEELKLMAINAMQHSDAEQTVPMLEKLLQGTASPRLKERALFVLAMNNSPLARQALKNVARGSSTPDLQWRAIQYMGIHGGQDSQAALTELYTGSADIEVKQRVLQALFLAGNVAKLTELAKSERNPELRRGAIQKLGMTGRKPGVEETLMQIYASDKDAATRRAVIQALFLQNNDTALISLARKEEDMTMKKELVQKLSLMTKSAAARDYMLELLNK